MTAVLSVPEAGERLSQGFGVLADLLGLTLGPTTGSVLVESLLGPRPESLLSGGLIARRVVAVPGRAQDVGAMLLRQLVWQTHREAGDGTATAAVLAHALLCGGHRLRRAGADAQDLRREIETAADAATATLRRMSRPIGGIDELERLALTVTRDAPLSRLLAELFDVIGPDGHITVEDYTTAHLEREYLEGGRWDGQVASPYLLTDPVAQRARLDTCSVALVDGTVEAPADVGRLVDQAAAAGAPSIAVFARAFSNAALGVLVANHQRGSISTLAIKLSASHAREDLEDLAVLTGATVLSLAAGRPLGSAQPGDLGRVRRLESGPKGIAAIGGAGGPAAIRERASALLGRARAAQDEHEGERLRFRSARLSGRTAVLRIGAATDAERNVRRERVEQGIRALSLASREGIVPGGGVALLACARDLRRLRDDETVVPGSIVLSRALEAPFRAIARNAGVAAPGVLLADVTRLGSPYGYDVLGERIVDMEAAGIVDPTGVLTRALKNAVSGAALALTVDTIVLRRNPEMSPRP